MKCSPELVCVWIELDRVCHPLGWLGEATPNFGGRVRGQPVRHCYRCWVEYWRRWKRMTSGCVRSSPVARWTGTHPPIAASSCDYLRDCRSHVISHACHYRRIHNPHLSLLVEESNCEADPAMSAVTLFGLLTFLIMISLMVLLTRLVSISILALGGPSFLFFIRTSHSLLAPHGVAVHCAGVTVWVAIGKDGLLILIHHQGMSISCVSKSGGGVPSTADTTLPQLEDTRGGQSGRWPGTSRGFKTPSSFNFATSSAVKSSKSPGRLVKTGSVARKGPTVQNGTSWHVDKLINGAAWLHSITRSGNNLGPNCMPLGMRRHPLWSTSYLLGSN